MSLFSLGSLLLAFGMAAGSSARSKKDEDEKPKHPAKKADDKDGRDESAADDTAAAKTGPHASATKANPKQSDHDDDKTDDKPSKAKSGKKSPDAKAEDNEFEAPTAEEKLNQEDKTAEREKNLKENKQSLKETAKTNNRADETENDGLDPDQDIVIRVKDLRKSFGGKRILDGLTVDLKRGENLAVMGKSGTGKSVLIKCIVRLIEPDAGTIEVFGKDMDGMSNREIDDVRLHIGFLFQSGALYDSMSVRENMEFPLRRHKPDMSDAEVNDAVEGVLKSVGLSHAIDKMPSELSGGMRKRAGLARTLILRPDIMLYDEPTTGLDTATSHEISDLINSVRDEYNVSSIIITHDLPCAKTCADKIMILKEGKNGAFGTYDELAKSKDEFVRSLFH